MARPSLLASLLLSLATATATAAAQAPAIGSTVRVRGACPTDANCPTVTGTLRQRVGDSLVIRQLNGVDRHLRLGPTATLEYPHGSRRYTLEGLGIGVVAGLVFGSIEKSNCESAGGWFCGLAVPGGLLLGGGVGALVGSVIHTARWEPVPHAALVTRRVGNRSVLAIEVKF